MSGRLLVFEGPEGSGKTTQIARLARHLAEHGVDHVVVREPGGTPLGESVRTILLDPEGDVDPRAEALLFMASRAELLRRVVRPAMARGSLVVADRFFLSTYAYQIHGRGLPEREVREANALATGGLVPDLTILLAHSAREGLARADRRGARDRIENAEPEFHERVAAAFALFATPEWQRDHPECGSIAVVDGARTVEEVTSRIMSILASTWPDFAALARSAPEGSAGVIRA